MTIKDLLIEGIGFGGEVYVGGSDARPHWTGKLYPGVEDDLREEDGSLPAWFANMEVIAIGAAEDGGLIMVVR